jgi:DNA invertase Pin-like site-specific DNA recombinase
VRQILGAISTWEKLALVQKLRASRLHIRRAGGKCEGKQPFTKTAKEQKVIETILEHRNSGLPSAAIAERLNADGLKFRSGKQGHPTQVQRVIQRATKEEKCENRKSEQSV